MSLKTNSGISGQKVGVKGSATKTSTIFAGNCRKKVLDPPSSASDVFIGILLALCRKYLFVSTLTRIIYLGTFVFLGSLLSPLLPLPRDWYFAQKHNFLNQYFVKLGWGWTLCCVGPFIALTSLVYSAGDWRNVRQQLARLVVGTVVWYVCTSLFVGVERRSGSCSVASGTSFRDCSKQGGTWMPGFDISGHCFLLIYCCLLIVEETKAFRNWDRIRLLADADPSCTPDIALLNQTELDTIKKNHAHYTPYIRGLFVLLAALHLIWEFMIVITTLFYHTFPHKMAGSSIALLCWFFTYRLWYYMPYSPGLPAHCKLRYIK